MHFTDVFHGPVLEVEVQTGLVVVRVLLREQTGGTEGRVALKPGRGQRLAPNRAVAKTNPLGNHKFSVLISIDHLHERSGTKLEFALLYHSANDMRHPFCCQPEQQSEEKSERRDCNHVLGLHLSREMAPVPNLHRLQNLCPLLLVQLELG